MTTLINKLSEIEEIKDFKDFALTYGHFNTIHPGHIRYLKYAKSLSGFLVIAIIGDIKVGNNRKFQFSQKERSEALAMLEIADLIINLDNQEIDTVVEKLKPKYLVLGKEKESEHNVEAEISKAINFQKESGGLVRFEAGEVNYASTDLLSNSEMDLIEKRRVEFRAACKRQNIGKDTLLAALDKWQSTKLIVVGDIIVDQYAACEALGLSAEAPVVVVKELEQKNFIGAAGIVASHIRSLGAKCDLHSVVGNDDNKKFVSDIINEYNISNFLIEDPSRPTTFKKRYLVENQKIFRVSRLEDNFISKEIEQKIIENIEFSARDADGIIISDFVYGVITEKLINSIHRIAKKYNLKLIADIQCSSQIGSITKFKNFTLLCPNEREARIALQDKSTSLENISQNLLRITEAEKLIMKLGAAGFIAYEKNNLGEYLSQSFPALSVNPLDVSGAGDSLLAVMSIGLASGQSMMVSSALAACMAGLSVQIMGNTPIKSQSLRKNIIEIFN